MLLSLFIYSLYQKEWYSQKICFINMKFVEKVYVFDTISKRNKCFLLLFKIILFAFVNQELCHVLCDEAKSRLCHFLYLS